MNPNRCFRSDVDEDIRDALHRVFGAHNVQCEWNAGEDSEDYL